MREVLMKEEILAKIADLEAALGDVDLPEEAADALVALRLNVQTLDDIVLIEDADADPTL